MSDTGDPEGIVSREDVARLAELFDRFEFAFDPRSTAAKEAESEFQSRVVQIFEERVLPRYPNLPFPVFYCRLKTLCRIYLKKSRP
ncbi:MAG: hypothetical protein N3I86_00890 [Verrucomicrobiae bacterium]|nr:hypothetical protein [Verrucomicrobiae bacterium]MDW8309502.1 hypothetical protein [Verrucomicrobiales bacterium]